MLRPHRADGRVPVPAPQCSRTTRSKPPFGNNAVCSYAAVQPLRQERARRVGRGRTWITLTTNEHPACAIAPTHRVRHHQPSEALMLSLALSERSSMATAR